MSTRHAACDATPMGLVPERPAFVPLRMLLDPGDWDTRLPRWREDADPAAVSAARLQHGLAYRMREYIQNKGWDRATAGEKLGMSRGTLWRLLEGHSPITLVTASAWARVLGQQIKAVDSDPE